MMQAQRGQTLPIWTMGTLSLLLMLFFVLNYSGIMYSQIRAQSAADAAAQGLLSVQATQWNQEIMLLHASAVEEFRIRRLLDGMVLAIHGDGGCTAGTGAPTTCASVYASLRQNYINAVARYTNDVALMARVSTPNQGDIEARMNALLAAYQENCGQPNGGDCAFTYTRVDISPRNNAYLENVEADAAGLVVGGGTSSTAKLDFTPLQIEVVACAKIQPLFSKFFHLSAAPFIAVGRAAATNLMVTQEWMDPGHLTNPAPYGDGVTPFQPTEYPESPSNRPIFGTSGYDWYSVQFGGNPNQAFPTSNAFSENVNNDEFSEQTGWWSSIPILPYKGQLTPGTSFACKS